PPSCCDNCFRAGIGVETTSHEPLEILRCVQQLPREVGRKKLAAILRGTKEKSLIERDYHLLPAFGKIKNRSGKALLAMVDRLLGDGYLQADGGLYPVVTLTPLGRQAVARGEALPLPPEATDHKLQVAKVPVDQPEPDPDAVLLAALKEYRSYLVQEHKMAAFVFFQNRVLAEIARAKPDTLAKMSRIPGIGPKKLAAYGAELLAIVQKHLSLSEDEQKNTKT
ncbi:MAG: HRDC domain-containing protein, partial [Heliobacteriaceae bacterium]|nr:HRDC domain-containing protein [Heliobacteriaceae bacterium]